MRNRSLKNKTNDYLAVPGSGNVFADIGVPSPEEALLKSELARQIGEIIKKNRWTQAEAAAAIGIDQPKVSALLRGRLRDFSIDRLVRFVHGLNQDAEITIKPKRTLKTVAGSPRRRLQPTART